MRSLVRVTVKRFTYHEASGNLCECGVWSSHYCCLPPHKEGSLISILTSNGQPPCWGSYLNTGLGTWAEIQSYQGWTTDAWECVILCLLSKLHQGRCEGMTNWPALVAEPKRSTPLIPKLSTERDSEPVPRQLNRFRWNIWKHYTVSCKPTAFFYICLLYHLLDLRQIPCEVAESITLVQSSARLAWTWHWTFWFHKRCGIYRRTAWLPASYHSVNLLRHWSVYGCRIIEGTSVRNREIHC
jgi:hypothetical protein